MKNVSAIENTNGVSVTWDKYCNDVNDVVGLQVYRRSCDLSPVELDYCTTGVPASWGFVKIAQLDRTEVSYLDTDIFKGNKYYYLLVAQSSTDNSVLSVPSAIDSVQTFLEGPWITHASVLGGHDSLVGKVFIDWRFSSSFTEPGPYKIELLRSDSLKLGDYLSIDTLELIDRSDSSFIDQSLDTYNGKYSYKIRVHYGVDQFQESQSVSIIDVSAVADERDITLSWKSNAPLFTPDSLFNDIHRDYPLFNLLDSIQGESYSFVDEGLISDSTYCYYVVKPTTYCNQVIDTVFYVKSNVSCDTTYDFVAPCPPLLFIDYLDCGTYDSSVEIKNNLWWEWDNNVCEEEEIDFYELYYRAKEEQDFVSVVKTKDTFYVHKFINSYAGCYKIRAQDMSGNLGGFSNEVCNQNCESIEFPNVVTPNRDGKNDVFGPIPVPQFVSKIHFSVVNRWGALVFQSDDTIDVLWGLTNTSGEDVVDGVYYYEAIVTFHKYKKEDREKLYKGWFVIVR